MKQCLGLLALCFVVAACGSSARVVSPAPHGTTPRLVPPSPIAFRFSTASNRAFARQDVRKLLHIVVLPPSARLLTKAPVGAPRWLKYQLAHPGRSRSAAQARRVWLVREPVAQVRRFIRAHARPTPRPEDLFGGKSNPIGARTNGDYAFAPVPGRSWSRYLSVDMTRLRGGSTIVLADAQEIWNHRSPKSAVLPSRVKRIDITSRYYGERKSVLVHVRNRFDVASIVSWMNGLSAGPLSVCFGFFGGGPTVTLTFHSASGDLLGKAQVNLGYGSPGSGPCNPFRLTIVTRAPVGLIGGDILLRVQRLLGIDVAPVSPRVVAACLRGDGWVAHIHQHTLPVRIVAIHRGRMSAITFRLSGKVTTSGPAARAIARCLRARSAFWGYG